MSTVVLPISVNATCVHCGKERRTKPDKRGGIKLPSGWKRENEATVCRECWQERYILRALTFAVASPLNLSGETERPSAWKELETALRPLWAEVTEASNWMMTQLYVRDVRRGDADKMPPMPPAYLYPEARILFPNLQASTVASLEQTVQRKYRAKRYDIIWVHRASLATMRYPQPLPIPNQAWKYWINDQNQPIVEARIGETRWRLRLKSGARYRRQTTGLKHMAERGELGIYKAHDGTILVKLVGWLKREEKKVKVNDAALIVRTGSDHLLAALDVKEERLWIENCDQVARWIAEHRRQLQRWAEDQKAEQRPVASFSARRELTVQKYHSRIQSCIQEVAAHVANFAARRRYTAVTYDDSQRWLEGFPYAALEARLKINLDEKQIGFVKEVKKDAKEEGNIQFDAPPSGAGAT